MVVAFQISRWGVDSKYCGLFACQDRESGVRTAFKTYITLATAKRPRISKNFSDVSQELARIALVNPSPAIRATRFALIPVKKRKEPRTNAELFCDWKGTV
jgi:hypothetical protein